MSSVGGSTSTSSVAPTYDDSASSPSTRANGSPGELMPGPFEALACSNDIGAQLTTLIVKASREQKESARECRRSAEESQRAAEERQLEEMRDQADAKLTAGLVEGAAKVAGGTGGLFTAASDKLTQMYTESASKIGEGAAAGVAAVYRHSADHDGVDAKAAEQDADRAKRAAGDARDVEKDAKELLDRALSYYKEYLTAKSDTQRATLLRA